MIPQMDFKNKLDTQIHKYGDAGKSKEKMCSIEGNEKEKVCSN